MWYSKVSSSVLPRSTQRIIRGDRWALRWKTSLRWRTSPRNLAANSDSNSATNSWSWSCYASSFFHPSMILYEPFRDRIWPSSFDLCHSTGQTPKNICCSKITKMNCFAFLSTSRKPGVLFCTVPNRIPARAERSWRKTAGDEAGDVVRLVAAQLFKQLLVKYYVGFLYPDNWFNLKKS